MPTNPSTRPQIPNAGQQGTDPNIGPVPPSPSPTSGNIPAGQIAPPPPDISQFIDTSLLQGNKPSS